MSRDEQEMALWVSVCGPLLVSDRTAFDSLIARADLAVDKFRRRYPPQPAAPEAVWYDTPPRPGEYFVEGLPAVCWVDEDVVWHPAWDSAGEHPRIRELPRNGRRVSPVAKPKEPQPVAPNAVWYDEPPFPKDGTSYPCWIAGHSSPSIVYWAGRNWRAIHSDDRNPDHLNGRRVCPIVKPPEPTP